MAMLFLLFACAPADSAASDTSYKDDVRPILDRNCARCHTAGGQAISFDEGAAVANLSASISAYLRSGHMPPAAPDPSCKDYVDSDRFWLSDDERAVIDAWIAEGTPIDTDPGPSADAPTTLDHHDVELYGGTPYSPDFDATGNDYRCFAVPIGNTETVYMTGAEALVDNLQIVHHVVIFTSSNNGQLDESPEGFDCDGLGNPNWDLVAAWAPGANPIVFPDGMGYKLKADARLILQMHYYNGYDGAEDAVDQSGYALTYVDDVDRVVKQYGLGSTQFTIPAGDAAYPVSESYEMSSQSLEILGVWPHMHVLGSAIDERIIRADGTEECLLHQDKWDFHNQVYAQFTESTIVNPGDQIAMTCTYDNSADSPGQTNSPPVDVGFGEGTNDEMCFGFTYAVTAE